MEYDINGHHLCAVSRGHFHPVLRCESKVGVVADDHRALGGHHRNPQPDSVCDELKNQSCIAHAGHDRGWRRSGAERVSHAEQKIDFFAQRHKLFSVREVFDADVFDPDFMALGLKLNAAFVAIDDCAIENFFAIDPVLEDIALTDENQSVPFA